MSVRLRPMRYAHSEGHTDMCYTEDGNGIITCGSDGDIRVWADFEDDEPESHCVGEGALSVCQKAERLYVCTDDGKVLSLQYPSCERDGLMARFTAPGTHVVAATGAPLLACTSEDFSVRVLQLEGNSAPVVFGETQAPALAVSLSPSGKYVAASYGDGKLYIWNVETKSLTKTIDCVPYSNSFYTSSVLCRSSFDPKNKFFAYPFNKEVIVLAVERFEKICTLTNPNMQGTLSIAQFSPCGRYLAASSQDGELCVWHFQSKAVIGMAVHSEQENICSLHWNPKGNGQIAYCDKNGQIGLADVTLDEADDGVNATGVEDDINAEMLGAADDDDEDGENVISVEKLKQQVMRPGSAASGSVSLSGIGSRAQSPERERGPPPLLLQPPLQPGSSPQHLQRRYLAYNHIGLMLAYNDDEADEPSIDIQFHDATVSRGMFMRNSLGHTVGALSERVVALACETPSKLMCVPVGGSAGSSRQWTAELPGLEEAICVAASNRLVAVGTDTRMVRVFGVYGTQRTVLSVPGPLLSIAAYEECLFVIHHTITAYSKDQNLTGMLIQFRGMNMTSRFLPVPLSPQSRLSWMGFTDLGSPVTYDSEGILRWYGKKEGVWMPVFSALDHARGAADTYFVISVSERTQSVCAVLCKGAAYPPTSPRPVPTELPLRAPLCEPDTDKTRLEEQLWRGTLLDRQKGATSRPEQEQQIKEAVVKLFVLASKSELDDRALELLEIVGSVQLATLGLKYANKLNRRRLVEKLTDLVHQLEQREDSEDENEDEVQQTVHQQNKTLKRRRENEINGKEKSTPESQESFMHSPVASSTQLSTQDLSITRLTAKPGFNPFSKKHAQENTIKNPLALGMKGTETANPAPVASTSGLNTQSGASTSTSAEKSVSLNGKVEINPPKSEMKFVDWLKVEKPNLEAKFPDFTEIQLTKMAMQIFKRNAEKRKATDEPEGSKNKQSKLSAFAYTKNNVK